MSASGKKEVMSEAELKHRVIAGQMRATHGAYAFRDRGEAALKPTDRSRLSELREQVQDKTSLLAIMEEKAADIVLMFEIVQSHVASEVRNGVPLTDIPAVKYLPAFFNSMQRALANLWAIMPGDGAPANAELERIKKVIDEHDNKNAE